MKKNGWLLIDSRKVTASPKDYQTYIHRSQGEFTCVKPYYVHLQTAWIGDRTISYLASGKPAIMQHTGPSRFLPETAGLFRFRTLEEAVQCLEEASRDYDKHGRLARSLAEEYFDGEKVAAKLLERALL